MKVRPQQTGELYEELDNYKNKIINLEMQVDVLTRQMSELIDKIRCQENTEYVIVKNNNYNPYMNNNYS